MTHDYSQPVPVVHNVMGSEKAEIGRLLHISENRRRGVIELLDANCQTHAPGIRITFWRVNSSNEASSLPDSTVLAVGKHAFPQVYLPGSRNINTEARMGIRELAPD